MIPRPDPDDLAGPGGPADPAAPARAVASILIEAPVARVWSVLTDLADWPRWNTDIHDLSVSGPLAIGTRFDWKSGGLSIRSEIDRLRAPHMIGWRGRAPLIRARHVCLLRSRGSATEVETLEAFFGPVAWLLPGPTRYRLEAALHAGNAMLKRACEAGSGIADGTGGSAGPGRAGAVMDRDHRTQGAAQ